VKYQIPVFPEISGSMDMAGKIASMMAYSRIFSNLHAN
jgi:hypothetical protein